MRQLWLVLAAVLLVTQVASAQAGEAMSDAEVELVRDASFIPAECLVTYERILTSREKELNGLLAKPKHVDTPLNIHDAIDQIAAIADELADHLDDYDKKHRDLRKALPQLVKETERWATSLRAVADDAAYNVVRKLALDTVTDMREQAVAMEGEQAQYFKEHPEAVKLEKERLAHPHDTVVAPQ